MAIPHLFRCPISLDLFRDPVTLCTGQTYDRSGIETWLAAGNLTCPVTMQRLHDPTIVPNHTLRHLIDEWLQLGHQFDPDYLAKIESLASLKHNLESQDSTLHNKLQALEKVQVLSQESSSSWSSCLFQLGFMPLLLELVFGSVVLDEAELSDDHIKLVEQSLSCVLKLLPLGELESLNVLKEESKFSSFLVLFKKGTTAIKMNLCHLIDALSSSVETKELCGMLGKSTQILQQMVAFVKLNDLASDAGIRAIWALCSMEHNREYLVRGGMIDALVTYISGTERRERSMAAMAMETIEKLLGLESGKDALVNNPNAIKAFVKMVFRVSDHEGSESAIESLMVICCRCLQAREEAVSAGVLTQLLLLLQSQCSGRTKTKARLLLKLLRSKWKEDPKHV
ncbi:hypothetical protein FNV43_RR18887 [Rhamnella rubrinervis]|uniref:U-box domain-containing protein n=1 Tax=Rhamnella rubrinervis TaxID=2594499 RepID=A0A8K0E4K8_9ROSA|nr:hypothetical protein FNV43_RR18887 [Rhamnella rubrinervis]